MKDYYEILGVMKEASEEEIKRAYRKLAFEYHPDKTKGDKKKEEKFKQITEAYETLKDQNKRKNYDNRGNQSVFDNFSGFGFDINNFFKNKNENNNFYESIINLTLEDIYFEKEIERIIIENEKCNHCHGSGHENDEYDFCETCDGNGVIENTIGNFFVTQSTCNKCDGHGKIFKNKCKKCNGMRFLTNEKKIKIKIPNFVSHGDRLKMNNYLLTIQLEKHEKYEIKNKDLVYTENIPFTFAMLGGKIEIPTIDGKTISIDIKDIIMEDTILRIKKKGMKTVNKDYGDMYIKFKIEYPKKITEKQKKILKEFEKITF
jgi:molecular chaperone DnaJ